MTLHPATVRILDEWLPRTQRAARVPSLSAAVARAGEVVWTGAVGVRDPARRTAESSESVAPSQSVASGSSTGSVASGASTGSVESTGSAATTDTRYRVGSITKPLVAVAVLQLVAEGRLDLEAPIGDVLPDAPSRAASVAEHLDHTSGLAAEPTGAWWERSPGPSWAELVAAPPALLTAPGRRHHYSNTGYAVLGHLLEVLDGEPWDVVVRRRVLDPLGLAHTGPTADASSATGVAVHPFADVWHPEPVMDHQAMAPAGAMWSTPRDLVRFGSWTLGNVVADRTVLPADLLAQMYEPRTLADTPDTPWVSAHGLGLQITNQGGARRWGHGGSVPGFTAELWCDPASGDVAAVCASATHPVGAAHGLLDLVAATQPAPTRPYVLDPDQADVAGLCGVWYWGPNPYTLTALPALAPGRSVRLALAPLTGGRRETTFERAGSRGTWVGVVGDYWLGEELRPLSRGDAEPYALDIGTFLFTRVPYEPGTGTPGAHPEDAWR
ncbi:serine hydrolase domain-containing protein [Raineyella sp. LH-20]|uniref:serine hydrolase domain-containing protein n=1 Tax=Raineyella sp. LH-20 TaxID=3081204 RepID=UPI002954F972|nr:serine hydrolase domain-containing protein [Raineyella sp. LH-20]WOP20157.1 serine hydrolase domain-containing protein [Raineyella sp. LH-20]